MFPSNSRKHGYISLVPVTGVEPVRYHYHRILSPARLPIPSHRQKIRTWIISDLTFAILSQKVYFVKRENKKITVFQKIKKLRYFKELNRRYFIWMYLKLPNFTVGAGFPSHSHQSHSKERKCDRFPTIFIDSLKKIIYTLKYLKISLWPCGIW